MRHFIVVPRATYTISPGGGWVETVDWDELYIVEYVEPATNDNGFVVYPPVIQTIEYHARYDKAPLYRYGGDAITRVMKRRIVTRSFDDYMVNMVWQAVVRRDPHCATFTIKPVAWGLVQLRPDERSF